MAEVFYELWDSIGEIEEAIGDCLELQRLVDVYEATKNAVLAIIRRKRELAEKAEAKIVELESELLGVEEDSGNVDQALNSAYHEIDRLKFRIDELEAPRMMKRWGVDGVPDNMTKIWVYCEGFDSAELITITGNEIGTGMLYGVNGGKITHWLELEAPAVLPEGGAK